MPCQSTEINRTYEFSQYRIFDYGFIILYACTTRYFNKDASGNVVRCFFMHGCFAIPLSASLRDKLKKTI